MPVPRHRENSRMPSFYPKVAHSMANNGNFVAEIISVMSEQYLIAKSILNAIRPLIMSIRFALVWPRLCPYYTHRGHGCARTTHTAVTVVPVLHTPRSRLCPYYTHRGHGCARTTHTTVTAVPVLHTPRSRLCPYYTHHGHGCARTKHTAVTVVPVLHTPRSRLCPYYTHHGHGCARTTHTAVTVVPVLHSGLFQYL